RRKSGDDKFLLVVSFGFDEIVGAARAVRRVAQFGDDAFEIELLGMLENDAAIAVETFDITDRTDTLCQQQPLQFGLALDQRQSSEIAAVKIKQIEHVVDEAIAAAGFQIGL